MNKLCKFFKINLFKTLLFNFRFLKGRRKFKFIFIVFNGIKIEKLGGGEQIYISNECKKIEIGCPGSFNLKRQGLWKLDKNGKINFGEGKIYLGAGIKILVNGTLSLGKDFQINANSLLNCSNEILIKDNVLIGWESQIMDGDGHKIIKLGKVTNNSKPILISDNVWITSRCSILKGTVIPSNCIISSGTTLAKKLNETNCIYANKGEIISKIDKWEY